ncbi:uncharacterized protein LOC134235738 isoform X2 [Saccostrea cucullata]|uniref:uncharacterized protein LOC134235738 isoform X2 n=1 Tax=Saccostrea cuccullata TaxID=36930 RepID=UPI002ED5286D
MRKLQYIISTYIKMYFTGLFTWLSFLLIKITSNDLEPVDPLCSKSQGHTRCCAGYRTIKDKCHPCNGSFGIECSNTCPEGYFGNQCEDKCFCDRCDARTGECYNETTSINNSQNGKDKERILIPWTGILLGLLGSIGSVAVLFSVLFLKEREKLLRRKAKQDDTEGNEYTDHELEEDNYASVRESRMVLDEEGACGGLKICKALEDDNKEKTWTMLNPYDGLSFNIS